ncbi:flavodoxin domain-containing protein [Amphritea balenae]|uniref:Flavodoxin/nitric oxide synthase n=1 Tax=Amphritea balenae TaxID=452629 RepID=A0A3P1SL59_9GAMM|nr:flavodoxin domain-containing protein [Amphritea balenae]RRC97707.1 flavodoxin/nitric oxide synthase [Amphritea balenae]RRC97991.1 flavodoxin/nitric oxide synthase [Amphritea balenae]GGK66537.1 flavodoxin [Amphritea balenae]GGK82347.1 flavodoxin [Amphritea balenae]
MADIAILVGTESGNAQMVADTLSDELGMDHDVVVHEEPEADELDLASREILIICCSTHGDGELPDNIIPLHDALKEGDMDLSHIKYGIVALGDQTYHQTFCQAGKDMDAVFAARGAVRVGERLEIDACTQPLPDEDALDWAKEFMSEL